MSRIFLFLLLLLPYATIHAEGTTTELTYTLNDGILTISGGTYTGTQPWESQAADIRIAVIDQCDASTTCANMFKGCTNLKAVDLLGITTSGITTTTDMFLNCTPDVIRLPADYQGGLPSTSETVSYHEVTWDNAYTKLQNELTMQTGLSHDATFARVENIEQGTLTIGSSGLSTLCYPASIKTIYSNDERIGFKAYTVTGIDNNTQYLVLSEVNGISIPDHTPVIIYWPYADGETTGSHTITLPAVNNVSMAPVPVKKDGNILVGANNSYIITGAEKYILQHKKNTASPAFYSLGEQQITTTPYRCYLVLPDNASSSENAKPLSLSFDDEVTAINTLTTTKAPQGVYTISGQPVSSPLKPNTPYIINGVKVIIR